MFDKWDDFEKTHKNIIRKRVQTIVDKLEIFHRNRYFGGVTDEEISASAVPTKDWNIGSSALILTSRIVELFLCTRLRNISRESQEDKSLTAARDLANKFDMTCEADTDDFLSQLIAIVRSEGK